MGTMMRAPLWLNVVIFAVCIIAAFPVTAGGKRDIARAAAGRMLQRDAARDASVAARAAAAREARQILRADRARDAASRAKPLSRERVVRRYTTAAQAEKEAASGVPAGNHMTASAGPGRPLSAEGATKKYGLAKEPERVMTIRIPQHQRVRFNKTLGGRRAGVGEITSTQKIPPAAVISVKPVQRKGMNTRNAPAQQ